MRFAVGENLRELPSAPPESEDAEQGPLLELLSAGDASEYCRNLAGYPVFSRILKEAGRYSQVELLPGCTLGTLVLPDRQYALQRSFSAVFYISGKRLLLAAPEESLPKLRELFLSEELKSSHTVFQLFFRFLEIQIREGALLLHNYEERLSTMEEAVTESFPREWEKNMNLCRRELLKLYACYQQMMDTCEILAGNDNQLFPEEYAGHFSRLASRLGRLYDQIQMLREYALQIREIYQSQMDLKQNDTMRMLTVVTTIFLPLSLLTGWYGMNFEHMPELRAPAAYFILIAICLALVLLEIWYFKKKGWL